MKVRIAGTVEVRNDEDYELVTDASIIKGFAGYKYTEEEAADYIGDGAGEEVYHAIGLKGGFIELQFDDAAKELWVITEYDSPRKLIDNEVRFLVEYTQGQWSDGMGENMEIPYADENGLRPECYYKDQTIRVTQH